MTTNSELLTALENERRYVARELHDTVAQTVQQLGLHGGICRKLADLGEVEKLLEQLEGLESRIQLASTQIREMISDLRKPLIGRNSGLLEYIEYAIETHQSREKINNVTYRNRLDEEIPNLSVEQILVLYRIAQEALFNIRKHAKAKNILVDLSADEKNLYLTLADDGVGFDVSELKERPPDKGGAGMANLHARTHAIGGTLLISKGTTAGGTAVLATLPLDDQPWW
ncbi:histidine kinase [Anaerolineales bacterium HSG25]|nr:histidine kinase [Anaerolineales bacterium HSG25]